ncbi:MAG: winged helix-turn-helix domain-containing protein [Bifidobacteriaceae bacterium]|jgi:hypothetical protein|nr:winged helix-turn-helix domain-containing protein [Bifidobacteriaceae bacterium]
MSSDMKYTAAIISKSQKYINALKSEFTNSFKILTFKKTDQFLTFLEIDANYRNNLKIIWFDFQLGDITTPLMRNSFFTSKKTKISVQVFDSKRDAQSEIKERIISYKDLIIKQRDFLNLGENSNFIYNSETGVIAYNNDKTELTFSENKIFKTLYLSAGIFINKLDLEYKIYDVASQRYESTAINTYITRIRKKLKNLNTELENCIVLKRNFGWKFELPE